MTFFKNHTEYSCLCKPTLQYIADGLTVWQIAQKFKVSDHIVESLILTMRKNNNCPNITTLIVMAMREGVVK